MSCEFYDVSNCYPRGKERQTHKIIIMETVELVEEYLMSALSFLNDLDHHKRLLELGHRDPQELHSKLHHQEDVISSDTWTILSKTQDPISKDWLKKIFWGLCWRLC